MMEEQNLNNTPETNYGDANIIEDSSAESFDLCGVAKKINTKATGTSMSFKDIKKSDKYETFYCDKPTKEPTCIPMRPRPKGRH